MSKKQRESSADNLFATLGAGVQESEAATRVSETKGRATTFAHERVLSPSAVKQTDKRDRPQMIARMKIPTDRIRIWKEHDRDYSALNEEKCADLIEGFSAKGQQIPAIVREINDPDDPHIAYEIVVGARRHWTAQFLGMDLVAEIRNVGDKDAFELQEEENRKRKDISDFERAKRYKVALEKYYDGRAVRMAREAGISESQLSRHKAIWELDEEMPELVAALLHPTLLTGNGAGKLRTMVATRTQKEKVREVLASLDGKKLRLKELIELIERSSKSRKRENTHKGSHIDQEYTDKHGRPVLRFKKSPRGGVTIAIKEKLELSREELMEVLQEAVFSHYQ